LNTAFRSISERSGSFRAALALLGTAAAARAQTLDLSRARLVDLTHPLNARTLS
jgi:hypothetical protein